MKKIQNQKIHLKVLILKYNIQKKDQNNLEMKIQKIVAHPNVVHLKGKVAIQRGPLIYCIESFDNNESGMNFSLNSETEFKI